MGVSINIPPTTIDKKNLQGNISDFIPGCTQNCGLNKNLNSKINKIRSTPKLGHNSWVSKKRRRDSPACCPSTMLLTIISKSKDKFV